MAGKGVLLEGLEVVLIVAALGAGPEGLAPAVAGAAVAVVFVVALGAVLHRPLARLPESHLKYAVGVVLSSFGVFFLGEGLGVEWPGGDAALLYLALAFVAAAQAAGRRRRGAARGGAGLMRALRKLVLGETWTLPLGVATLRSRWCSTRSPATRRGGATPAGSCCWLRAARWRSLAPAWRRR